MDRPLPLLLPLYFHGFPPDVCGLALAPPPPPEGIGFASGMNEPAPLISAAIVKYSMPAWPGKWKV